MQLSATSSCYETMSSLTCMTLTTRLPMSEVAPIYGASSTMGNYTSSHSVHTKLMCVFSSSMMCIFRTFSPNIKYAHIHDGQQAKQLMLHNSDTNG